MFSGLRQSDLFWTNCLPECIQIGCFDIVWVVFNPTSPQEAIWHAYHPKSHRFSLERGFGLNHPKPGTQLSQMDFQKLGNGLIWTDKRLPHLILGVLNFQTVVWQLPRSFCTQRQTAKESPDLLTKQTQFLTQFLIYRGAKLTWDLKSGRVSSKSVENLFTLDILTCKKKVSDPRSLISLQKYFCYSRNSVFRLPIQFL